MLCAFPFVLVLVAISTPASADPNDWVNIDYVVRRPSTRASTAAAQNAIVAGAGSTASKGPWTVTNTGDRLPPNKNPHDYLSWAPYHWPNCNWCPAKRDYLEKNPPASSDPDSEESLKRADSSSQHPFDGLQQLNVPDLNPIGGPPPLATQAPTGTTPDNQDNSQTTGHPAHGTPAPALAPAKTQKGGKSCTPSSTSLAPSATWTTCPYVVRDGQVNPDVRTLNGPSSITSVSQSVLYNALSYAFKGSPTYSRNVITFLRTFFLDASTGMNPNMNYGQMVRGPGKAGQSGTFTGILDLRGVVKVVNAVLVLRALKAPEWVTVDGGMKEWMREYTEWLENSPLGQNTASRPNNHGSFYISQLAATKILLEDNAGAKAVLQRYFTKQFRDQIATSGEQPFEAARTRPFHYRCFNLEAMITNAKLADQLGLDFWSAQSKYGSTIQTAVNYAMSVDPKSEDPRELAPHVAAVAAAYGDPQGKYAGWMGRVMGNYQGKPFWFYDQTEALGSSPAANSKRLREVRAVTWAREDCDTVMPRAVTFSCPEVFATAPSVEIDNDIFVTCEQLRPLYEAVGPLS